MPVMAPGNGGGGSAAARFLASMVLDLDRWKDGAGYDLEALSDAAPEDRAAIEAAVLARLPRSWHDIEALAALDTPRARQAIITALEDRDPAVWAAILRHAPHLVPDERRTALLVEGLEDAAFYGGLTQFLDQVEAWHPPPVVDAMFRGVLRREGEVAVHLAAMLLYVHGRAAEAFDWAHRPFLLRFNTDDRAVRVAAFRELCARVGVDAGRWLEPAVDGTGLGILPQQPGGT